MPEIIYDKNSIVDLFKAPPDNKEPITPREAVELITDILCYCSGEELCIIAEQLQALKHAMDRYK